MSCPDDTTAANDALTKALKGPAKVSGDAGSVEQHKLSDLIQVDRYLASKCAAKNPRRGIRFTKLIPPGAC